MLVSTATGNKKVKKHTQLIQWSDGTVLTRKPKDNKVFPFDVAPSTLIYCKEAAAFETLSKAYAAHWTEYDHIMGYQKFTKGKLPKVLNPEDADKRRHLLGRQRTREDQTVAAFGRNNPRSGMSSVRFVYCLHGCLVKVVVV